MTDEEILIIDINVKLKTEVRRKLVHMSAALAIPASFFVPYELIVIIGAIIAMSYMAAEYFRHKRENVAFMTDVIKCCTRAKESDGWMLTPFYLLVTVTVLIGLTPVIGMRAAYVGILAATVGDSTAALIGMRFGRHRHWLMRGKSVEGAVGFFVATLLTSLLLVPWATAIAVAAVTAAVEVFSSKFDNITVPLVATMIAGLM